VWSVKLNVIPRGEVSVVIRRPVEEVFDYMADFAADPEWRSGVAAMRTTSPQRRGLGATHVEVRRLFGRTMESPAEVIGYDAPRCIVFRRTSGPIRPQGTYIYERADGGTRLTFILEVPLPERWRALSLPIALLTRLICLASVRDFQRLKRLLERRERA
jgi:hypothetical protein